MRSATTPARRFNEGAESISRIQVKADGPWTITIKDLAKARQIEGTRADGVGDDLVIMPVPGRATASLACPGCTSNFIVHAYTRTGRAESIVNEIGSYSGAVVLPNDSFLFSVQVGTSFRNPTAPSWSITVQP